MLRYRVSGPSRGGKEYIKIKVPGCGIYVSSRRDVGPNSRISAGLSGQSRYPWAPGSPPRCARSSPANSASWLPRVTKRSTKAVFAPDALAETSAGRRARMTGSSPTARPRADQVRPPCAYTEIQGVGTLTGVRHQFSLAKWLSRRFTPLRGKRPDRLAGSRTAPRSLCPCPRNRSRTCPSQWRKRLVLPNTI